MVLGKQTQKSVTPTKESLKSDSLLIADGSRLFSSSRSVHYPSLQYPG